MLVQDSVVGLRQKTRSESHGTRAVGRPEGYSRRFQNRKEMENAKKQQYLVIGGCSVGNNATIECGAYEFGGCIRMKANELMGKVVFVDATDGHARPKVQ